MSQSSFWRDVRWQAVGNAAAQLIGILGLPVLTRLYTPEDMAAQAVFLQFAMFFTGVMTLRYEYFVQLPKEDAEAIHLFQWVLALAVVGSLLLTPLMATITSLWAMTGSASRWSAWLWLTPLTAALISTSLAQQHYAQRAGHFRASGLGEVAAKTGFFVFGVAAAYLHFGTLGLLLTTAFGCAAKLGFLRLIGPGLRVEFLLPLNRLQRAPLLQAARRHAHLSLSMVTSHLCGTVTGLAPILYIAHAYGDNALGQFNLVSMTIFLPASLIGNAIGQVFYQRAARQWADGEDFADLWLKTVARLASFSLPIYLLIAVLSPWAYPLIFGSQWHEAGLLAPWIAAPAACAFISTPMERSCLITGRWKYQMGWFAARAVTTVGVVLMARHLQWSFVEFIRALVTQMSLLYLFDLTMEFRFSRLKPGPDGAPLSS